MLYLVAIVMGVGSFLVGVCVDALIRIYSKRHRTA